MCYAKPGPRCSNYASKALSDAHIAWDDARTNGECSIAMKNIKEAEEQYDTTPVGQRDLKSTILLERDPGGVFSARLERGIAKRKQMLRDMKAKDVVDIDDDKPSVEWANGTKEWYLNEVRHRGGDKPAVERANGDKEWWVNGKSHREGDKPAIDRANGDKEWYVNGELHRDGGKPAVEYADGFKAWWVDGEFVKSNY